MKSRLRIGGSDFYFLKGAGLYRLNRAMLKLLLWLQNHLKNRTFISILLVFMVKKIGTLKGII